MNKAAKTPAEVIAEQCALMDAKVASKQYRKSLKSFKLFNAKVQSEVNRETATQRAVDGLLNRIENAKAENRLGKSDRALLGLDKDEKGTNGTNGTNGKAKAGTNGTNGKAKAAKVAATTVN